MKEKQFWRFDFKTDSDIDVSIKSSRIISSKEITAKSKNVPGKVIKSKIRKEDGILLANFNHFAKTGEVKAIGLVIDFDPETQEPVVSWKKKTFSLHPNPSGGIKQWKNEVCFKFADDPARRYRLAQIFEDAFKGSESIRHKKNEPKYFGSIDSVKSLEEFGRTRLSKSFFLREFLHSEISQIHGIPNIPDDPELAIAAGRQLCKNLLEPIQEKLGRISIRSAYRSSSVNAKGADNKNQYNCAKNEKNFGGHIWDRRDQDGFMGATACVVICSFVPYYERTGDWTALAWWIHDNIPAYAKMQFFPKLAAFNLRWSENPDFPKSIQTYVKNPHTGDKKTLTKVGMDNFTGSHAEYYTEYLNDIGPAILT